MGQIDHRLSLGFVMRSDELRLDPYGAATIHAMSVKARALGCDLVVMLATAEHQDDLCDQVAASNVDGAIVCAPSLGDKLANEIVEQVGGRPVVFLGRTRPDSDVPAVEVEYVQSTALLVGHLLDTAGPRIIMLAGPAGRFDSELRIDGFRLAHDRRDLLPDESKIVHGDFTRRSGYQLAQYVLEEEPDSIFAANDEMCLGVALAASERGLSIPLDLSLAGFDGSSGVRIDEPRLTTATQPFVSLAEASINSLVTAIHGNPVPVVTLLDPELHFGWSTRIDTT